MNGDGIAHESIQVLTFDLQGETFAIEATMVQEVLDRVAETFVPGAPDFVDAMINFRGKIIPLATMHVPFGMVPGPPTADSRVVVIEFDFGDGGSLIGLKADKVYEVTTIEASCTEPAPRVGMKWRKDFVRRLVKQGDDIIVMPDLDQIFTNRGRPDGVVWLNS